MLRKELISSIANKLDSMGWKIIIQINSNLPKLIRSKTIEKSKKKEDLNLNLEKMSKVVGIVNNSSSFKKEILIKRIPRIVKEPLTRKISLDIIKQTSEKSMVRLVKVAAGVNQ